jgi:hypothetical protein
MTEDELNKRVHAILEPDGCCHEWNKVNAPSYAREIGGTQAYILERQKCIHCNTKRVEVEGRYKINPTYSHSDEIAALMMERGLLDDFLIWHGNEIEGMCHQLFDHYLFPRDVVDIMRIVDKTIILTPSLLKTAIVSWDDRREK